MNWSRRSRLQKVLLVTALAFISIGLIGSLTASDDETPAAATAQTAATNAPSTTLESATPTSAGTAATTTSAQPTTSTTTTTTTATTTTTLPPFSEPIELSGSSDDVVPIDIPGDAAAVALIKGSGSGNFAVWSYDDDGEPIDLLVNEIGSYSGIRPLNLQDRTVAFFEVSSSGSWEIIVAPLSAAPSMDSTTYTGRGDYVLIMESPGSNDPARITFTHSGSSNFAVWQYGLADVKLLVNEIGSYQGTVLGVRDALLFDISADGSWSVNVEN